MMKRIKLFNVLAALVGAFALSAQAETYDYTEWAKYTKGTLTIGKSLSLKMPEEGECFYKLAGVTTGGEYTIQASDTNAYIEVLYTYQYVDKYEGGSDTYIESAEIGAQDSVSEPWYIEKASWEELIEDPTSETGAKVKPKAFYLYISGDEGMTVTVTSSKGIVAPPKKGSVTVRIKGAPSATWSLKGQTGVAYTNGQTVAILGSQTVVFSKQPGLTTPADETVTPREDGAEFEIDGVYNDTFDPKDDTVAGATKLTVSAKEGTAARTLFDSDVADHFAFTAKAGTYFNFKLANLEGDAVMTLFKKGAEETPVTNGVTKITALPLASGDYILKVTHSETDADSSYTLAYSSANVGAISFAKTEVTAKKSAGTVTLTVNRSSAEGKVRVLYGTVNATAKPGVDYYATNGELAWENGDKKAKTITIKLIPEEFAEENISRRFAVRLKPVAKDDLEEGEYLASVTSGKDVATVTVTEATAKAPAEPKKATVVKSETGPLETGTYQGVIAEDGFALTNGFPALASVTFTAKNATKKALSAKVILGGKTYSFSADTWSDASDTQTAVAEMTLVQKIDRTTSCTNTLVITVARGETSEAGDWTNAVAAVELSMNVPDAKGKGYQADVSYTGEIYRDNSKIQGYLDEVVDAVGYYTVALVPTDMFSEVPAGNGYLTLTIDNKGKAKIAGLLADGTTKPTYTSIVAIRDDGETLLVPVFVAKSPYCFGGTLKLVRGEDGKYVVDPLESLFWNNDNALLTYEGEEGWRAELEPVGGYFNTVYNLQAHYLTYSTSLEMAETSELLEEALADGYAYVSENAEPAGAEVTILGNTLATDKKTLVKNGKLVDFASSINPCNMQVKLTRATGLVTGSFSVWTENEAGTAQKEITGFKHNGILLLSGGGTSTLLDDAVLSAGFFTQTATLKYEDANGKTKTRKYTASYPFNILAKNWDEDGDETDWYDDDWGEMPAAD